MHTYTRLRARTDPYASSQIQPPSNKSSFCVHLDERSGPHRKTSKIRTDKWRFAIKLKKLLSAVASGLFFINRYIGNLDGMKSRVVVRTSFRVKARKRRRKGTEGRTTRRAENSTCSAVTYRVLGIKILLARAYIARSLFSTPLFQSKLTMIYTLLRGIRLPPPFRPLFLLLFQLSFSSSWSIFFHSSSSNQMAKENHVQRDNDVKNRATSRPVNSYQTLAPLFFHSFRFNEFNHSKS